MTTSTAFRTHRVRRGPLVGGVAAVAGAAAIAAALTFGGGDTTQVDRARPPSNETILSSLSPEQRRYVQWVVAASPEELAAVYGGPVQPVPLKAGSNQR